MDSSMQTQPIRYLGMATACLAIALAGCRTLSPTVPAAITKDMQLPAAEQEPPSTGNQVDYIAEASGVQPTALQLPVEGEPAELVPPPTSPDQAAVRTEQQFVDLAVSGHPRVRAARARIAAATNRPVQARSLEDPILSNSFFPISDQALQTAGGRAGNTLALSQKYPWPEKRWTKEAIANREVQIADAKLSQVELEVEELARLAYYELWFAVRSIGITEKNREVAVELVKLAEARNATGGSQQDILRAQLQVDNIDDRLVELRRRRALAEADLAAVIQQPETASFTPTDALDLSGAETRVESLVAAAERCNPRLRERQWAVSRDRQKERLACLQKYPDFNFGVGWQTITESDAISPVANGNDNVSFMVSLTLPIWRERIRAGVNEARWEVAASSRDYRDARDDTVRQIRRFADTATAASEQRRLYADRMLPRAKRQVELATADYRGGRVDFGEVADGFTEMFMLELQVVRAEASLAGSLAQLKRAVGCEVVPSP